MAENFWYDLGSEILGAVIACLGDPCEYETYVATGRPQAECNSIAFWVDNSSPTIASRVEKCRMYRRETVRLTITRCCGAVDSQVEFDPTREDKDASCFLADLDTIMRCLCGELPTILKDRRIDCRDEHPLRDVIFDQERQGDCYSADLLITFERSVACECPPGE